MNKFLVSLGLIVAAITILPSMVAENNVATHTINNNNIKKLNQLKELKGESWLSNQGVDYQNCLGAFQDGFFHNDQYIDCRDNLLQADLNRMLGK